MERAEVDDLSEDLSGFPFGRIIDEEDCGREGGDRENDGESERAGVIATQPVNFLLGDEGEGVLVMNVESGWFAT